MAQGFDDERDFVELVEKIFRKRGVNCGQYKINYLKRRLAVRMRMNSVTSYREYIRYLDENPGEYEKFMDTLTINVTQFFRDILTYQGFRETVLPRVMTAKRRGIKAIKIWSAGCATGEEPYSIAMILIEILAKDPDRWNAQVLASDIDKVVLAKAEAGIFGQESLSKLPEEYLKYFRPSADEKYEIADEVKRLVKFYEENFMNPRPLSGLDVVFCRNVMIYFSRELQYKLYEHFWRALSDKGYLIVGNTEVLIGETSKLFQPVDIKSRIYQKSSSR
ncbi:MAG: protein-glutamate O-methyltransferase CheR [Armatimonadetes bacterium]|nr:protein-glutamate O-methyltransferase CheR [Armatimonadota bacterium]